MERLLNRFFFLVYFVVNTIKFRPSQYFFNSLLFFLCCNISTSLVFYGHVRNVEIYVALATAVAWYLFIAVVDTWFADVDRTFSRQRFKNGAIGNRILFVLSGIFAISALVIRYKWGQNFWYGLVTGLLILTFLARIATAYAAARTNQVQRVR